MSSVHRRKFIEAFSIISTLVIFLPYNFTEEMLWQFIEAFSIFDWYFTITLPVFTVSPARHLDSNKSILRLAWSLVRWRTWRNVWMVQVNIPGWQPGGELESGSGKGGSCLLGHCWLRHCELYHIIVDIVDIVDSAAVSKSFRHIIVDIVDIVDFVDSATVRKSFICLPYIRLATTIDLHVFVGTNFVDSATELSWAINYIRLLSCQVELLEHPTWVNLSRQTLLRLVQVKLFCTFFWLSLPVWWTQTLIQNTSQANPIKLFT